MALSARRAETTWLDGFVRASGDLRVVTIDP
jgi:hypothetical protein